MLRATVRASCRTLVWFFAFGVIFGVAFGGLLFGPFLVVAGTVYGREPFPLG
jgi:hypothetical protein